MKRLRFLLVMTVFMVALALLISAVAQARTVTGWTPIFEGVWTAAGVDSVPRPQRVYAVRVDLDSPYTQTFATPSNGTAPYETALQTTPAFLTAYGLKAAVNATFFDAGLSPNTNLIGLTISCANLVSGADASNIGQCYFYADKTAVVVDSTTNPSSVWTAVGGARMILSNGSNIGYVTDVDPRTAVGISQDGRYLIMLVVDGRETGWSEGCNYHELADWMLDFGAWDAINCDGGGSSTLVKSDGAGGATTLNSPCYGYARAVGASLGVTSSPFYGPPYLFGSNTENWRAGNSSAVSWTSGYSGSIYFDQAVNDCNIYSGTTNFVGYSASAQTLNVDVYIQSGTGTSHDMQAFWKTNAEDYWDTAKSTPVVSYTVANSTWTAVNLVMNNNKWWSQTVNGLRLDVDNTSHGNRFIINHIVKQNSLWWPFGADTQGWTAYHSLSTPWWTDCCSWPGILVTDQTGDDAVLQSPAIPVDGNHPYNYLGGLNDKIHVRVYPQNGTTANHDMAVYWRTTADGTYTESKSTHVTYTGQNQWVDVYLPVGNNANWVEDHITQIRLDFDNTNHGNRWIVDTISTEY